MKAVLLLTAEEQAMADKHCRNIIENAGAEIQREELDNFETTEQSRFRLNSFGLQPSARLQSIADQLNTQLAKNGDIGNIDFSQLSEEDLHRIFSMLGAVGVSVFIEIGIRNCASEEDVMAVASLTRVRHGLLLSNREYFPSHQ